MKNQKSTQSPVIIRLTTDPGKEKTKNLRAYVVDAGGSVIEHAPFEGTEARLKSSQSTLEGKTKVYIAHDLSKASGISRITERTLLKASAYEVVKNFNDNTLIVSRVPSGVFIPFPFFNCLITGHVNKNFFINGQWVNLPLCDLRVHICEVETELRWPYVPIYYRPIPDWVISEIGQKFAELQPPVPDPIGPISATKVNLSLRSLSLSNPNGLKTTRDSASSAAPVMSSPAPLPDHVLNALTSGSVDVIRKTITDYYHLIYPYLCWWPIYWPWIYTYDEETIVTTDCNGHFEMWENTFFEDGPLNIYIWVEAFINGSWVTVYKPALVCHTWWNYLCGTNINITVTDPRVGPCHCGADGPGDAFWFRSIGDYAGALHIEQNQANTRTLQGTAIKNVGCTNILGYDWISPFGGGLNFEVFAGENIYSSGTGVTHFRWKATRICDENLNPIPLGFQTTTILNANSKVYREYLVKFGTFTYLSFNLEIAPDGTGTNVAFRIPHQDIMLEPTIVAAYPGHEISWRDIFWISASFDSSALQGDGLYRFDLELGKYSGSNFVVTNVNPNTFQISQLADLDSSQNPTAAYLNMSGALAHNYTMLVRVDNAHCTADIHDAQLTETGALSGPCGFIKYTDPNQQQHVHLSFQASHPRNFAWFNYDVVKGNNTQNTNIHPHGYVLASVSPFTLAGGLYGDDFTVAYLLNTCPLQAAFSENLYVTSIATDGSNRMQAYDASDVNAFALSNT